MITKSVECDRDLIIKERHANSPDFGEKIYMFKKDCSITEAIHVKYIKFKAKFYTFHKINM